MRSEGCSLCGLTFEVSGRRRQDAKPELAKMYRVPPAWAWWPAGGAPLDRGVRRRLSVKLPRSPDEEQSHAASER